MVGNGPEGRLERWRHGRLLELAEVWWRRGSGAQQVKARAPGMRERGREGYWKLRHFVPKLVAVLSSPETRWLRRSTPAGRAPLCGGDVDGALGLAGGGARV